MANLLISLRKQPLFLTLYQPSGSPEETNILDEAFVLVSIEPQFRLVTVRNLMRVIYSMLNFSKINLKYILKFNETYLHIIYKLGEEYLSNEIFASFMLDVFEDNIREFEYFSFISS